MKAQIYRRFSVCFLIAAMTLCLSACGCIHKWQGPTCQARKICTKCGITEGEPLPHTWGSTDCLNPDPCAVCGTLDGIELTHQWRDDAPICKACGLDQRPVDVQFMEKLTAGLEQRWTLEKAAREEKKTLTREDWEAFFRAEYDQVLPFEDKTFEDETLETLARQYIGGIAASMETLEQFGTKEWHNLYTNGTYFTQALALYKIHNLTPLTVAEENQANLQEILEDGEALEVVSKFFDEVYFHKVNLYSTYRCEAFVENTTPYTFSTFAFDVNVLDQNGNVLETQTTSVMDWTPGEKVTFSFVTEHNYYDVQVKHATWMFYS